VVLIVLASEASKEVLSVTGVNEVEEGEEVLKGL